MTTIIEDRPCVCGHFYGNHADRISVINGEQVPIRQCQREGCPCEDYAPDRPLGEDEPRLVPPWMADRSAANSDDDPLQEARGWARHGYELAQRSATWSDQGVAPKWLTGWHDPAALRGSGEGVGMSDTPTQQADLGRVSDADADRVLACPMDPERNGAKATTVREYLVGMLRKLWREEADFSGKRPFGNSDWQWDVYRDLVVAGFITGEIDPDEGWMDNCDDEVGEQLILAAIDRLLITPSWEVS